MRRLELFLIHEDDTRREFSFCLPISLCFSVKIEIKYVWLAFAFLFSQRECRSWRSDISPQQQWSENDSYYYFIVSSCFCPSIDPVYPKISTGTSATNTSRIRERTVVTVHRAPLRCMFREVFCTLIVCRKFSCGTTTTANKRKS